MYQTSTLTAAVHRTLALFVTALLFLLGLPDAQAHGKKRTSSLSLTPSIGEISLNDDGKLVASGSATADVRGRDISADFDDVEVTISIAEDQTGAGDCPNLEIEIGAIDFNLLGLNVQTSPICLRISGIDDTEDLDGLLCEVADLVEAGTSLEDILEGTNLTEEEAEQFLTGLQDLVNGTLESLLDATVDDVEHMRGRTCAVISLSLEPVDLTVDDIDVHLASCEDEDEDGPVTLEVTVRRGGLLGNLLCQHLRREDIEEGATLEEILDDFLDRLNR